MKGLVYKVGYAIGWLFGMAIVKPTRFVMETIATAIESIVDGFNNGGYED